MEPGICGLLMIIVFAVQIISATVHFALDELNDTDFSEEENTKKFYDIYTDDYLRDKRTFFTGTVLGVWILLFCTFRIWLFINPLLPVSDMAKIGIFVILSFLLLVLYLGIGILMPYYLSFVSPKAKLIRFCRFYRMLEAVTAPLAMTATGLAVLISSVLGVDTGKDLDDVTQEDVIDLIHEGHEQGVFKASEAVMIQNIFAFDDKIAKDIMVNRKNMVALDGETDFKEAIRFFNENHFSRIPVYMNDLDEIIGIIHMKEVLKYSDRSDLYHKKIKDFKELMNEPEFVPETHGIHTLFTQMQLSKNHLIIVVDEYGQTSGLVTMEDILEEIVGNIQDEHDEEKDMVTQIHKDHFRMQGSTPMEEVINTLGIDLKDCEFETLNGFLTDQYGNVPEDGARFSIEFGGCRFDVLNVKNRIISDVSVTKLTPENSPGEDVADS